MNNISTALTTLGIKGSAQRVFAYLSENGVSPVSKIADGIRTPKPSIYDALKELGDAKLVIEYDQGRSKEYGSVSTEQLKDIVANKISEIKSAESALISFIQNQDKNKTSIKPKLKFYSGVEGIRQAFRDTMWHNDCKETFLMWPTNEMIDILTPEFSKWHSEQRLRYKVFMKVVRKHSDRTLDKMGADKSALLESDGWKNDRAVRYAPKDTTWSMSCWIYDDKCLFASSAGDKFAFVVHSREFADVQKLLWNQMWNVSEE